MANQLRPRGGRGTSLGFLSGRLRGGFTASAIPRSSTLLDSGPISPANSPSPSLTESVSGVQDTCSIDMLRSILETVKKIDRKVVAMEQQQNKIVESIKELSTIVKSQERANFSIKGSPWEVPLKEQTAKLFCESVTREPADTDIHAAVARVVGRVNSKERHKIQLALKYVKAKLTEFRAEERRKVLGHAPYKSYCFMSTRDLGMQIMQQMLTPGDVDEEIYIRSLALFRKFARLSDNDKTATYQVFREWLGTDTIVSDEEWKELMDEDEAFDYANRGVGREQGSVEQASEEQIETENLSGHLSDFEGHED